MTSDVLVADLKSFFMNLVSQEHRCVSGELIAKAPDLSILIDSRLWQATFLILRQPVGDLINGFLLFDWFTIHGSQLGSVFDDQPSELVRRSLMST